MAALNPGLELDHVDTGGDGKSVRRQDARIRPGDPDQRAASARVVPNRLDVGVS